MPIYSVTVKTNPEVTKLVRAKAKSTAINHVIGSLVEAEALSADEYADAVAGGGVLENASEPAKDPAAEQGYTVAAEATNAEQKPA